MMPRTTAEAMYGVYHSPFTRSGYRPNVCVSGGTAMPACGLEENLGGFGAADGFVTAECAVGEAVDDAAAEEVEDGGALLRAPVNVE